MERLTIGRDASLLVDFLGSEMCVSTTDYCVHLNPDEAADMRDRITEWLQGLMRDGAW